MMISKRRVLLNAFFLQIIFHGLAQQVYATDVAIIEELDSHRTDLSLFEVLQEGREIQLQPMEAISIGYLQSCNREIIIGGNVRIGISMSTIEGGSVVREKVSCAGDQIVLNESTADQAGVVVFRSGTKTREITLYQLLDVSPMVRLKHAAQVVILNRLDKVESPREFKAENNLIDFRKKQVVLVRGGSYEIRTDNNFVQFQISPNARINATLLERLVTL